MNNNIYIYKPLKGKLVYTQTIEGTTTTGVKKQFTYSNINANGNCLIEVYSQYTSPTSIADSYFPFENITVGNKTISENLTIKRDTYNNIYGQGCTHTMFANLSGINSISFTASAIVDPTMKIYEL